MHIFYPIVLGMDSRVSLMQDMYFNTELHSWYHTKFLKINVESGLSGVITTKEECLPCKQLVQVLSPSYHNPPTHKTKTKITPGSCELLYGTREGTIQGKGKPGSHSIILCPVSRLTLPADRELWGNHCDQLEISTSYSISVTNVPLV